MRRFLSLSAILLVSLLLIPSLALSDTEIIIEYGPGEDVTTTTTTTQPSETPPMPPGAPGGGELNGGGGPAPGPGDTDVSYLYTIEHPRMDIYQTVPDANILRIENTGNSALMNVEVSILGLPQDWYTISHGSLDEILPGESKRIDITFHAPATGTFNYEINITSDEDTVFVGGSLVVKELTPQAERELESRKTEEQKAQEAKRTINTISVLLVAFGILGPAIVAVYMLTFLLKKRCPLCGSRMIVDYKGKNFVTYRCSTCNYFHTEEREMKKKKKKGKE